MAKNYGRKVTLTWGGAAIPGVREKGISVNGEAVNVTSDEDNGIQTLLAEDAELGVEISLSGVTTSRDLMQAKLTGAIQAPVLITYEEGATIAGTFNLAGYSEAMPYSDAMTFEATLQSTGPVTFTPPGP